MTESDAIRRWKMLSPEARAFITQMMIGGIQHIRDCGEMKRARTRSASDARLLEIAAEYSSVARDVLIEAGR